MSTTFEFIGGPLDGDERELPDDTEIFTLGTLVQPLGLQLTPDTVVQVRNSLYRRGTLKKGPIRLAVLRWEGEV